MRVSEKYDKLKFFLVLYFCLSSIRFFDIIFIPSSLIYYNYYFLFLINLIFVLFFYKKSYFNRFSGVVFFIVIAVLCSGFSSIVFWRQDFLDTMKALTFPMGYLFFFSLVILKIDRVQIERIIIIMGVLYMLVFAVAYLMYPNTIFGNIGHWGTERGFQRISVRGLGFLFLLSFLALNNYMNKNEPKWLILYLLTLIFIVMKLSRSLMIFSFSVSLWFVMRKSSLIKKFIAVFFLSLFVFFVTQMDFFKLLVRETEIQIKDWRNDVRVRSADFYIHKFPPNTIAKIIGNGIPYYDSDYGKKVHRIESRYGYYIVDIGYFGIYTIYGIQMILALFVLLISLIWTESSINVLYSKYFLIFVFIVNIIIPVFIGSDFIPAIVLALYLLETDNLRNLKNSNQVLIV